MMGFDGAAGWSELTFADAPIEIIDGDRGKNYPGQEEFTRSGYCLFLNAGNVTKNGFDFSDCAFVSRERDQLLNKGKLKRNDSILTTRGTVGNVAFFGKDVSYQNLRINSGMVIVRPDERYLDAYYLYLFLRSSLFDEQVRALTSGSAQPQLPIRDIRRIKIPIPPLPEQRAIAATLGALDDKIDLNRRMNETLEAMARALFRDWFVDFGPTRAKMAGQAPYLSPALWDLFPASLDAEGKPEGWEVKPLSEAFHLLMGQSPPGDTYNDEGDGLPFFQGRTDFGFRFPENRKYCSAPTRIAEKGDTLVSVRAPVGDINIAAERCCIGRGVAALRHKDDRPSFTYYTAWALQEELRQYENTGTVFGAINRKQFEALPTVDPGSDLLKAFEETASAMDHQIKRNERETRILAQTRDLLLPRLMSGELRVAEADPAIEQVL